MICRTQPRRMKGRSVSSYCESKKEKRCIQIRKSRSPFTRQCPDILRWIVWDIPIFSDKALGGGLCPSALVRIVWKSVGYMHIKVYIKIKVLFMAVSRIGVVVNVRTTNDQSVHRWRCSPSFVHKENTNRVLSVFISFSSAFFFMASSSDIRTT